MTFKDLSIEIKLKSVLGIINLKININKNKNKYIIFS